MNLCSLSVNHIYHSVRFLMQTKTGEIAEKRLKFLLKKEKIGAHPKRQQAKDLIDKIRIKKHSLRNIAKQFGKHFPQPFDSSKQ